MNFSNKAQTNRRIQNHRMQQQKKLRVEHDYLLHLLEGTSHNTSLCSKMDKRSIAAKIKCFFGALTFMYFFLLQMV